MYVIIHTYIIHHINYTYLIIDLRKQNTASARVKPGECHPTLVVHFLVLVLKHFIHPRAGIWGSPKSRDT